MPADIRRRLPWRQNSPVEGERKVPGPSLLAAAMVIIKNPWLGCGYVENLRPEIRDYCPEIGKLLTGMPLGVTGERLEGCGKASVGRDADNPAGV